MPGSFLTIFNLATHKLYLRTTFAVLSYMCLLLFWNDKPTRKADVLGKKTVKPLYKHYSPGPHPLPRPSGGVVRQDCWIWACALVRSGGEVGHASQWSHQRGSRLLTPAPRIHTSWEGGSAPCVPGTFPFLQGPLRPFFQVSWALMTTRWRCCPRGLCRHLVAESEHYAFSPVLWGAVRIQSLLESIQVTVSFID